MLFEDPRIYRKLQKMIAGLAVNQELREDLLQEGLLHLWQVESRHPGQTESWYLQNCRFCVLHWLASGRSIDSRKRSTMATRISIEEPLDQCTPAEIPVEEGVVGTASFHDLQAVLSKHLRRREKAVLEGLVDGLGLPEIAAKLKLSYPTALKYRRRIAALVSRLEIPPSFTKGGRSFVP